MIYLSQHNIKNDITQKLSMYTPNILLKVNNQIENQLTEMMQIVIYKT